MNCISDRNSAELAVAGATSSNVMHTTTTTTTIINEQLFLVNGIESRLTIEPDSIVWRAAAAAVVNGRTTAATVAVAAANLTNNHNTSAPKNHHDNNNDRETSHHKTTAASANRLNFAQIIGTNHRSGSLVSNIANKKNNNNQKKKNSSKRFKLFYAKSNEFKSTSQLLKIKSLTIESIHSSSSSSSSSSKISRSSWTTTNNRAATKVDSDERSSENNQRPALARSISIEVSSSTATIIAGTTKNESDHLIQEEAQEAISEPPSCYASDGSTSHLSSSSTSSSACCSPTHTLSGGEQRQQQQLVSGTNSSISSSLSLNELCHLIEARIERERQQSNRPRRLLIFVNPYGGKGKAVRLYKSRVRHLLAIADVESKLIITKHANHARDTIEDPMFNVEYFDAIICIGGDGMFSELMNGLLFRYNREKILAAKPVVIAANQQKQQQQVSNERLQQHSCSNRHETTSLDSDGVVSQKSDDEQHKTISEHAIDLESLRKALGGIGQALISPPVPIGVIGAGSTDANSFGLIGTNDVVTATLNIILGKQIHIDICSVHTIEEDRLMRFVSTFVAYGYFGDVIRESEKLRWLGPSRYDVTGLNNLIKNRTYQGKVRVLVSNQDGSPRDTKRCHFNCDLCQQTRELPLDSELKFIEKQGSFVGVNAAITACRCPQTKKGFSPNNHLANGCVDLILVRPCSRMQYIQYLLRTGWTKKSAFDLKYVEAYRCRQFEFLTSSSPAAAAAAVVDNNHSIESILMSSNVSSSSSSAISSSSTSNSNSLESKIGTNSSSSSSSSNGSTSSCLANNINKKNLFSSWNVDGEILNEASIRVKVNNKLLRVFGTGEPNTFGANGTH